MRKIMNVTAGIILGITAAVVIFFLYCYYNLLPAEQLEELTGITHGGPIWHAESAILTFQIRLQNIISLF